MADIKRLQYTDGQLLDASDFTAEQDYHREMRMRHNRSIHGWGIVEGLEVKSDEKKITISPGTAIDKDGQELILLQEMTPLLSAELKSTIRYVTAKFEAVYDKTMEEKDKDTGTMYSRRTIERAKIEITETEPAKDGTIIVLAAIKWDAEGKIKIDSTARSRSVSSRIDPAADLTVGRLSLARTNDKRGALFLACLDDFNHALYNNSSNIDKEGAWDGARWNARQLDIRVNDGKKRQSALFINLDGKVGIGTTEPKSTLSVKGGLAVGTTYAGTNAAPDNVLLVEGKVGIGTTDPGSNALRVGNESVRFELGTGKKLSLGGNGSFEIDAPNIAGGRLVVTNDGKVGIGTTDPKSTLSVKGGLAVGTTYAGTNAAADNVLLVEGNVGIGTTNPIKGSGYPANWKGFHSVSDTHSLGIIEGKNLARLHLRTADNTKDKTQDFVIQNADNLLEFMWLGSSLGNRLHALAIDGDGKVGIGMTGPGANLDVSGAGNKAGQISLQLRSGNMADNYESNQIALGYANTAQYRHAIKTRHHSGQTAGNAIDFYVWQYGAESGAADRIGGLHTMTLNGGNVGIGATGPEAKLDVNGDVIVSGVIKGRYKDTPELDKNRSDITKKILEVVAKQKAAIIQGYGRGATAEPEKYPPHLFALSYDYDSRSTPGILDINTGYFKTFIIDHPVHDDKYLLHATLEGPEGAVYYRGAARLNNGKAQIQLPSYFEALTRAEGRTVLLTNVDGFDPLAVLTQDGAQIKDGRFIVISSSKESNQAFDWEVKAIRQDVQDLEVEPLKSALKVERFGPYAYAVSANGDRTRTQPPPANPNSTEPQAGAGGPRSKIATIR